MTTWGGNPLVRFRVEGPAKRTLPPRPLPIRLKPWEGQLAGGSTCPERPALSESCPSIPKGTTCRMNVSATTIINRAARFAPLKLKSFADAQRLDTHSVLSDGAAFWTVSHQTVSCSTGHQRAGRCSRGWPPSVQTEISPWSSPSQYRTLDAATRIITKPGVSIPSGK